MVLERFLVFLLSVHVIKVCEVRLSGRNYGALSSSMSGLDCLDNFVLEIKQALVLLYERVFLNIK
jgi:hypothetical protein